VTDLLWTASMTLLVIGVMLLMLALAGQLVARWWWAGFARLYEESWVDEPSRTPRFRLRRRA
jgi:hypothetical protein